MDQGVQGMTTEGSGSSFAFLSLKMKMPVTLFNPCLQKSVETFLEKTDISTQRKYVLFNQKLQLVLCEASKILEKMKEDLYLHGIFI